MSERNDSNNSNPEQGRRSDLVVAVYGEESQKTVDGQVQPAVTFVGADREGKFSQVGLGVILPESGKAYIWGLVVPHCLIQSWRGMKILEEVPVIEHGTLAACWYAGEREVHPSYQHYLEELASQIGHDRFEELRQQVLNQAPTNEELDQIISALRERDVEVEGWELKREIEAGRVNASPLIQTIIREEDERSQEYQRQEEELKRPLPKEQSLSALLQELGLDNFIIGGGVGGYGIDWGHTELDKLEESIRRHSRYSSEGETLQRTTRNPKTTRSEISRGVSMFRTDAGEIESPSVQAKDGTRYTFTNAKFVDGAFSIKTEVERPGQEAKEAEYTVPQLRQELEELLVIPAKPSLSQRVLRRFVKR